MLTKRITEPKTILEGKRATVVGLGREGITLAHFLLKRGAKVTISDRKSAEQLSENLAQIEGLPMKLSLGANRIEDIVTADIVFVSPGVPLNLPCLVAAKEQGIPISSSTRIFFEDCDVPIVGITGSSGKTTTTALTGEVFRAAGRKVFVGGNIGQPLLDKLDEITPDSWVILELSSFQLELLEQSPRVAAVLNITPNHLDVHHTMKDYIEAKRNILRYQEPEDFAILNLDDSTIKGLVSKCPGHVLLFSRTHDPKTDGAFVRSKQIIVRYAAREQTIASVGDVKLLGKHNLENVLAACAIATVCEIEPDPIAKAIFSFTGIEHRLELVRVLNSVQYYNDSIATTPERAIAGLRSFDKPIVLLAGGRDKHLPLERLARVIRQRCKAVVLFGEAQGRLRDAICTKRPEHQEPNLLGSDSFAQAVEKARGLAAPGDVVLLSPACTSFDLFRDFEERGREFKRLVNTW